MKVSEPLVLNKLFKGPTVHKWANDFKHIRKYAEGLTLASNNNNQPFWIQFMFLIFFSSQIYRVSFFLIVSVYIYIYIYIYIYTITCKKISTFWIWEEKIIKHIKWIQNGWLLLLDARVSSSAYFLMCIKSLAHWCTVGPLEKFIQYRGF